MRPGLAGPRAALGCALLLALCASRALAIDITAIIASINFLERTFTTADGRAFVWAEEFNPVGLRAGNEVTVTYTVKAGVNTATGIRTVRK